MDVYLRAALVGALFLISPFPAVRSEFTLVVTPGVGIDRSGVDLIVGKAWTSAEEITNVAASLAVDTTELRQRIPPEPFAIFAYGAALAALVFMWLRNDERAVWLSALALLMFTMIAISPTISYVGIAVVEVQIGFFLSWCLLAAVLVLSVLAVRAQAPRPVPPRPPMSPRV
jgi:hypothetical protein